MEMESKVALTYKIYDLGNCQTISVGHETGDDVVYIRLRDDGSTSNEIVLSIHVDAAEELVEALSQLVVKMRHEEQEAQSTKENESNG